MKFENRRASVHDPVDMHVCNRLRLIRMTKKMTQLVLAEKMGVSPQMLRGYELGENRIAAGRLYAAAKALDVPIKLFFDEMPRHIGSMTVERVYDMREEHWECYKIARLVMRLANRRHRIVVRTLIRGLMTSVDRQNEKREKEVI